MNDFIKSSTSASGAERRRNTESRATKQRLKSLRNALLCLSAVALLGVLAVGWLTSKANIINDEMSAGLLLIAPLKEAVADDNPEEAAKTVEKLREHTSVAREAAGDPIWTLASAIPGLGANFSAVAEMARSADDIAALGLTPLVNVFSSLDWDALLPDARGTNLEPIQEASPSLSSAAQAVRLSADRLDRIDSSNLLPQVSGPLTVARDQLGQITGSLDAAANAAGLAPEMLGAAGPRNYLLMIQNNAEARASGGIPGALAVLHLDNGKLELQAQSSPGAVGVMSPALTVEDEQEQIYSARMGRYIQDVNLTPDFPTAAGLAQSMWERTSGERVDGVISIDPVALSYILNATGPVSLDSPELVEIARGGLPTELTGKNVVRTLLSDVYDKIQQTTVQDIYFAGVAQEIFSALSSGDGDAKALVGGIAKGAEEGRILVWSSHSGEQSVIAKYPLSGSITGPSVLPAQFGVYFNDGTGAKMDYYVKRTVLLVKECARDGYEQTTVRVTSTNSAPADAATALPAYVTGGGNFGVPPGSVQTNIVVYGPVQANVEAATIDDKKTSFAAHKHGYRPVGSVTVRLAPAQSTTVELTFGKIVQHTEPNVVVTPTVQDVKDVILNTETAECG